MLAQARTSAAVSPAPSSHSNFPPIADVLALRAVAADLQREAVLARFGEQLRRGGALGGELSARRGKRHFGHDLTTPCAGGHGEREKRPASADTRRERIVGSVHMCATDVEPRDVTTLPRLGHECDCGGRPLSRDALVMTRLDLHRVFFQNGPAALVELPLTRRAFIVPRSEQSRVCGAYHSAAALWHDRRVYTESFHPNVW